MVCEERAPELAGAAIGRGDLSEGNAAAQIAEGLARGTPVAGIARRWRRNSRRRKGRLPRSSPPLPARSPE